MKCTHALVSGFLFAGVSVTQAAVTNLTPAEVHARLVAADNVLLLDVREWSDYTSGHIAEPAGYLPLTPACMPLTSHVIDSQYNRLPSDIDIIVTCQSGNRSATASTFLNGKGFTRIFNMTGGFSSWTSAGYESRTGGFGDHSGSWIRAIQSSVITVASSGSEDSSTLALTAQILRPGLDSAYFELHSAWGRLPIPSGIPASDVHGVYRVTAVDAYGVPLFVNDSVSSYGSVTLRCGPAFPNGASASSAISAPGFIVSSGINQWIPHAAVVSFPAYSLVENTLHRWYVALGSIAGSAVVRGHEPGIAGRASMAAVPSVLTSVDGKVSHASGHGVLVSIGDQSRRVVLTPSPMRR